MPRPKAKDVPQHNRRWTRSSTAFIGTMMMLAGFGTTASAQATGTPIGNTYAATIALAPASIPFASCGTWAMFGARNYGWLMSNRPAIDSALAIPGVKGLSLRAPWTGITSNLGVYDAGVQIVQSDHSTLAIRFIAGISTPSQFLGNSTIMRGRSIPLPWGQGSTPTSFLPNTVFESGYSAMVKQLAAYARKHGIHLLHLPWYGGLSAEMYRGLEVQIASGYSLQNFITGHERLAAIGMSVAGSDLSIEFPLSGVGSPVAPLESYMTSKYGTYNPELMVQFNDLTDVQPGPQHPANGLNKERQMLNQGDYDWTKVYQTLVIQKSHAVEVYLQSFDSSLAHAALLRQQVAAFASC